MTRSCNLDIYKLVMVVSTNVKGDDVNLTVWWCVLQGHLTNIRTTKVDSHQGNYSKIAMKGGGVSCAINVFEK